MHSACNMHPPAHLLYLHTKQLTLHGTQTRMFLCICIMSVCHVHVYAMLWKLNPMSQRPITFLLPVLLSSCLSYFKAHQHKLYLDFFRTVYCTLSKTGGVCMCTFLQISHHWMHARTNIFSYLDRGGSVESGNIRIMIGYCMTFKFSKI